MSNKSPQPRTTYYEEAHGLEPGHPDFWPVTLGTLGKVAAVLGAGVVLAWNAVDIEPARQPADRPAYEMPAVHNPVIDGQLPPLPQSPAPAATDIPYRTNP